MNYRTMHLLKLYMKHVSTNISVTLMRFTKRLRIGSTDLYDVYNSEIFIKLSMRLLLIQYGFQNTQNIET